MSTFEVLVERVSDVYDHPNADRLSIVKIRGYQCISAKVNGAHRYKIGDLVVYVPEDAIVPEFLLKRGFWDEKNNKGMLAGTKGDRVKAVRLRGTLSQGILFSVDMFDGFDPDAHFVLTHSFPGEYEIGDNVTDLIGITKYVPKIPENMGGDVTYIGSNVVKFDIENIKRYPDVISEGTDVVYEEKLHGSCCISGIIPSMNTPDLIKGNMFVASKGLANQGIVFKDTVENRERNVYVRAFHGHRVGEVLEYLSSNVFNGRPVFILGEVFGPGVQDLTYSLQEKKFAAFGFYVGEPGNGGEWLNPAEKYKIIEHVNEVLGIPISTPPVLYQGPHDVAKLAELTGGKSAIDGVTIREGIVITPAVGVYNEKIGRVILKSVSDEYLLRKGNTTEFQ